MPPPLSLTTERGAGMDEPERIARAALDVLQAAIFLGNPAPWCARALGDAAPMFSPMLSKITGEMSSSQAGTANGVVFKHHTKAIPDHVSHSDFLNGGYLTDQAYKNVVARHGVPEEYFFARIRSCADQLRVDPRWPVSRVLQRAIHGHEFKDICFVAKGPTNWLLGAACAALRGAHLLACCACACQKA